MYLGPQDMLTIQHMSSTRPKRQNAACLAMCCGPCRFPMGSQSCHPQQRLVYTALGQCRPV